MISNVADLFIYCCRTALSPSGRLSRRQYWVFVLTHLVIVSVMLWFTGHLPFFRYVTIIYAVLIILPFIMATVKRLHDIGKSGKALLLVLIPVAGWLTVFIWTVCTGREESNEYGGRIDFGI